MITTKAGYQVKIVSGSKKSITGKHPFVCEYVTSPEQMLKDLQIGRNIVAMGKRINLTRTELVYDSEQELWDALGLTKS